jgi:hypothetical protein
MKWYSGKAGDMRVESGFALLPVTLSSGVTVWLQRFWMVQRFRGNKWECSWNVLSTHETKAEADSAMLTPAPHERCPIPTPAPPRRGSVIPKPPPPPPTPTPDTILRS